MVVVLQMNLELQEDTQNASLYICYDLKLTILQRSASERDKGTLRKAQATFGSS